VTIDIAQMTVPTETDHLVRIADDHQVHITEVHQTLPIINSHPNTGATDQDLPTAKGPNATTQGRGTNSAAALRSGEHLNQVPQTLASRVEHRTIGQHNAT